MADNDSTTDTTDTTDNGTDSNATDNKGAGSAGTGTDAGDKTTATTTTAATAHPWDDLGSFDDVKKRLEFARTWEKRAKDNAAKAKKFDDLEEASKTETQKLTERLAAAEKDLNEYRLRDIRAKAAREAGLDADMADFMTAADEETARTQAKTLAKRVQPAKPDLRQGARPNQKPSQDMNTWLRRQAGYDHAP